MPRAFNPDERRIIEQRLMAAAAEVLGSPGLRQTSIARLARAAGISKGAFYSFFESKETLALALLKTAENELRQALTRAAEGPSPLTAVLRGIFDGVRVHPMLALLSDPDDFVWLTRSIPSAVLVEARADDDLWFGELFDRLVAVGAIHTDADRCAFVGVPGIALALAQRPDFVSRASADAVLLGLERVLTEPS